jgi:membrane protease YdiL (CAAX protease family)
LERARARVLLILLPPCLIVSTYFAFYLLAVILGSQRGYFLGFLFYWIFWCLVVPISVLGSERIRTVFARPVVSAFGKPSWVGVVALFLPLLLGYGYAFPRAFAADARWAVLVGSLVIALINGVLEELLWRGTYILIFPDSSLLGDAYPTLSFAVWHFAPQAVFPNRAPGGRIAFVLVSATIGSLWGWVAKTTGSIFWTSVTHVLFDFSGLGARIYFNP